MKNPNVLLLVKAALKAQGYDGLRNGVECSCDVYNLAPCGEIQCNCEAGYKVVPPADVGGRRFDFYICESRDDRPWETQE